MSVGRIVKLNPTYIEREFDSQHTLDLFDNGILSKFKTPKVQTTRTVRF